MDDDDDKEKHNWRYFWDRLLSRDVEDPVLACVTIGLLFFVAVIVLRSCTADYYIFDTSLDKYAFGSLALCLGFLGIGLLIVLWRGLGALLRFLLGVAAFVIAAVVIGFILLALVSGLRE